ncbi:hypothetical protein Theco_3177 [Thermobacillus composti KWC4]|uniref:Uncharacterized protein n=1 Tax=Thermobacillus composti (strain DSM 18247 / JCM 13945 / KWC4) TaxID=717605 RepID=L0EHF9_THECK|nr:hypothetical protein [Thermobacillus composti]AGA59232.1 hypothetical protein Theco_3177 [Thermobacillus composti KWC4]
MSYDGRAEAAGVSGGPVVVLHVVPGISAEGIGTFVLNMLEHLDRSKTKVLLAVTTDREQLHESRVRELGAEGGKGWASRLSRHRLAA